MKAGLKPTSDIYHRLCVVEERLEDFEARNNKQMAEVFNLLGELKTDINWLTKVSKNGGQQQ